MSTPPQNTEIWVCPCMLYWTTLSAGLGHYPMQSKLFFMQLEGFLVSQSRIPVRLILKWFANPYFAYLACTRPCKSTDLQYIVHTYKVVENILA